MDRRLSSAESAFHHARGACAPNIGVAVGLETVPDQGRLVQAARALQARHPLLNVVVRGDPWPRLVTAFAPAPLDLSWATMDTPHAWRTRFEAELARPLQVDHGPMVRVVVLAGPDGAVVIVVADHLIGDGRALNVLLDELFAFAGEAPPSGVRPELPPIDALLPRWPGARTLGRLASVSAAIARPTLDALGTMVPPSAPAPLPRVSVAHHTLDRASSDTLVARARAERCTVFGALAAALTQNLAKRGRHPGRQQLAVAVPVDLRDALSAPIAADDLGVWAWAPTHVFSVDRRAPFWELARDARARVEPTRRPAALRSASLLASLGSPWVEIPEVRRAMAAAVPQVDASAVLSNLGRVALPSLAPFGVRFAAYAAMVPDQDVVFIPASVGGCVQLTAAWTDRSALAPRLPDLPAAVAEALVRACR